jgi:hypothetical protein
MYTFIYVCALIAHYVYRAALSSVQARYNRRQGRDGLGL